MGQIGGCVTQSVHRRPTASVLIDGILAERCAQPERDMRREDGADSDAQLPDRVDPAPKMGQDRFGIWHNRPFAAGSATATEGAFSIAVFGRRKRCAATTVMPLFGSPAGCHSSFTA